MQHFHQSVVVFIVDVSGIDWELLVPISWSLEKLNIYENGIVKDPCLQC